MFISSSDSLISETELCETRNFRSVDDVDLLIGDSGKIRSTNTWELYLI